MKNLRKNKKAFSMIEIAIIIIVIGIMVVAALWVSNFLVKKSKIISAQSFTKSSPIYGIKDSILWLESSLDKSFKDEESSDRNSLSVWYDNRESTTKNNAIQSNSSNYPVYANTINHIQAVEFDGVNSYFTIPDASFLNNTDYTIFILEKRKSDKNNNYFIGDITSPNQSYNNKNLVLGYNSDSSIIHSQSSSNNYKSSVSNYSESQENPRIFTFLHSNTSGKKTYINGLLAAKSSDNSPINGMSSISIGKSYQGEIGEIAIFIRNLKPEERESVEDYLGKKWNVKILRGNGQSCEGGKVTPTGCQITCSVSVSGSSVTSVSAGDTQVACDAGGNYASTSFTFPACAGSPISGSCSCKTGYTGSNCSSCDTTNNYQMISGTCQKTCLIPADSGTTKTYVASGSTSTSCDDTSYYPRTMSYTCSSSGTLDITIPCVKKPVCTGGDGTPDITTVSGTTIHKFTTVGTSNFRCSVGGTVNYLIVAGGGGGGGRVGGGGGAGGLLTGSMTITSNTDYSVTVGVGGSAGGGSNWGTNGGNSSIGSSLIAIGGGAGGSSGGWWNGNNLGKDGGSGGGGSNSNLNGTTASGGVPAGNGTSGQGNNGAKNPSVGGGGGGAGAAATNGSRNGANGISNSITGTSTYYAGGGGGGGYSVNASGGLGGGGTGGSDSTISCTDGSDKTGGGGGGGSLSLNSSKGCKGGSGIVVITY